MVAWLRTCGLAEFSSASEMSGNCSITPGWAATSAIVAAAPSLRPCGPSVDAVVEEAREADQALGPAHVSCSSCTMSVPPAMYSAACAAGLGAERERGGQVAPDIERLRELYASGRNGIWPFVLRNLMRPLWLSRPEQRADVLLGNPPWIAYRHLSAEMKPRLREACQRMDLWVGGVLATQQDMAALFWARGAERYLREGGTIAFVLPYAALNRPAFGGLRRGDFGTVQVRIAEVWNLAQVRPIFGRTAVGTTSTCVVFGVRSAATPIPARVRQFAGTLPRETQVKQKLIRPSG